MTPSGSFLSNLRDKVTGIKPGLFNGVLLLTAFVVGFTIFFTVLRSAEEGTILHNAYEGGPLIAALMAMSIMVATYIFERLLSLGKAQGVAPMPEFLRKVIAAINGNQLDDAVRSCDLQRGSMANILRTGLSRYREVVGNGSLNQKEKIEEVKRVMEEATMLEMPSLERNLIALSTIASIATLVGLLGTVIGMIRSFAALARAGSPDAAQLSKGISEALFNTAGGIAIAIAAIVAYNFFTTKIDGMTYEIDEVSKDILRDLEAKHG